VFVEIQKIQTEYNRLSKNGRSHTYCRLKTVAILLCDACQNTFQRELGSTDRKRLSNHYRHVCNSCDQKSFAQRMGVESRNFWNISADTDLDISKL
jgi:hypothetical protein